VSKKARKTAATQKKAAKPAKKAVRAPVSKAKKAAAAPPPEIPLEQRAKSALDSAIARGVAGIATVLVDNEGSHAEINEAAANTAVQELSAYAREAVREKIQAVIAPESAEKKHGWQQPGPGRGHAAHAKMDSAAALAVIDDYADGITVAKSCEARNLRRTAFYDFINDAGNGHLKKLFESRTRAHCDAFLDEMADAPYKYADQQQVTNIYRINCWRAGKLIPKVYGDLQKLAIVDEKGKGVKLGAIVVPAKAGKPA
jgi:hypothetical protein